MNHHNEPIQHINDILRFHAIIFNWSENKLYKQEKKKKKKKKKKIYI